MRLVVAGAGASWPGEQPCSGHLVSSGDTTIMLDCGNGALASAQRFVDPAALSAVFITHEHVDHFGDLYCLQAMLRWAPGGPLPPMALYGPPGLLERMGRILSEKAAAELADAFAFRPLRAGDAVEAGPLTVTAMPAAHMGDSVGLRVTDGAALLAYTGDTRPSPEADALVRDGADVVLAEATLPAAFAGRAPHLTGAEAGALATLAGAHTLVLTHLWPTADTDALESDARSAFAGRVELGRPGLTVEVTPRR
jgi:ribonuclease BN (tRNA processing enzyme)